MTGSPLLSIIIPSFNQGRYLRQCIDSILSQDYRPIEVLVMDGASSDETLDVLRSYGAVPEVKWWSEPDSGPVEAVNKGLARANGSWASIQSSDDYYLPGAFTHAAAAFASHPECGLVYGEVEGVSVSGERQGTSQRPPHENALCIALCIVIPQCSAFFRTALGREIGGWRDCHTADWDFWLRMMFRTQARKIDPVLSAWRMYPGQRTDQLDKVYTSFRRMIDESPEVQRGGFRVRQAGRAAKQLIGVTFGPRRGATAQFWNFISAVILFPAIWPHVPYKRGIIPGFRVFQRVHGRLRHALRRAPCS